MEQEKLKEKLDEEIHKAARPLEELAPGDPHFIQLQGMLDIKSELENIPLNGTQRDMLLAMENVLEQAWAFRNTPVPDRCMDPENISEVVYYFLQDKGAEYRADLLYDRAKAEFDARMEEIAALPPKEILGCAYEKVIKEEFLYQMEGELPEDTVNVLLTYPQPLTVLFSEWMDNDYSFLDCIVDTMQDTVQRREKELRSCQFRVNGEPPQELKDYYELYGEELNNPDLESAGEVER